jgi:hypothetical protein
MSGSQHFLPAAVTFTAVVSVQEDKPPRRAISGMNEHRNYLLSWSKIRNRDQLLHRC